LHGFLDDEGDPGANVGQPRLIPMRINKDFIPRWNEVKSGDPRARGTTGLRSMMERSEIPRVQLRRKGAKGVRSMMEQTEIPRVTAHRWQLVAEVPTDK